MRVLPYFTQKKHHSLIKELDDIWDHKLRECVPGLKCVQDVEEKYVQDVEEKCVPAKRRRKKK